ncbi:MAG TPA: ATP-binding protein [Opitutaceae bacterium]|nr:ATP-binding protein [Opitutaceae bacterium]
MPQAAPGIVETGAPSFSVVAAESMGLDGPPTDIDLMPDGRLLVVAGQQLALGDGVRWEVFRQAYGDVPSEGMEAVVDKDGSIYLGAPGKGAKVIFREDGRWRLERSPGPRRPAEAEPPIPKQVQDTGDEWYWHSSSGRIIAWHPGESPRTVAEGNTLETIFPFAGSLFVADRIRGQLTRIDGAIATPVMANGIRSAITCAQPYDKHHMLVGTYQDGLELFDGKTTTPFPTGSLIPSGTRINTICSTGGGMFAVAVDNYGIYFFNHDGAGIQVLDHSLDHRLSGVRKLLMGPGGVLWGVADGAIVRADFPSRLSHFEPLVGAGITTVHPYRLDGKLWMMIDGRVYRGVYDGDNRLVDINSDTPGLHFVGALSVAPGLAIAGTEDGSYYRGESGWILFSPETANLRILSEHPVDGRWLYAADNQLGWLKVSDGAVSIVEHIPAPGLSKSYNAVIESTGRIWLELGASKVGLVRFENGVPSLQILTEANGLTESWAQIFEINGVVRFNLAEHIMRFDDASQRVVPDQPFINSIPGMGNLTGRPGLDSMGRLWITANGVVNVMENTAGVWHRISDPIEVGFQPYYFTFESGGVVWLHAMHRLARFDPGTQAGPPVQMKAIITQLSLAAGSRTLFNNGHELPPLDYGDNSLIAHFLASGNSFAVPVTFDVKLDGSGGDWAPVGSAGSAAFNRLKEGHYVLHVRPRSGARPGDEAVLAFDILPPWYRTPAAYAAYILAALAALGLPVVLTRILERRENLRLERLVAERTREVSATNTRLESQVEEIRVLSQAVAQSPIAVYITTAERVIEFSNPRASELTGYSPGELLGIDIRTIRAAGESARVFNHIEAAMQKRESWRGQLITIRKDGRRIHVRTTISPMFSPDGMIRHRLVLEEDITEWLEDQERGKRLESQLAQVRKMESIGTLAGGIAHDFNNILTGILGYCELARMSVEDEDPIVPELEQIRIAGLRAKDLVTQILTFSRQGNAKLVPLDLLRPVTEALKLIRASASVSVEITQDLEEGRVLGDATQIHQIVVNLCANSLHAMRDRRGTLEISIRRVLVDEKLAGEIPNLKAGSYMRLTVSDNGHGMEQATLDRIFDPFFTTKSQGEGTGLGLAIVQGVVVGHGGALHVNSRVEVGSTFDLYFPTTEEIPADPSPSADSPKGNGQRILLVEDEPSVSSFASSRLKQLGYVPVTFNDPREALAAFKDAPESFDALVTDLTMPNMTGLELISQVRPLRPTLPVVIFTGFGRELTREKLAAVPRSFLLLKPFSGEELARALSHVLA